MPAAQWEHGDLILAVKITARASRDQCQGIHDERYKIAITAPPEDGKANKHLIAWLAQTFAVAKKSVVLQSGEYSPLKILRISAPKHLPADWQLPEQP